MPHRCWHAVLSQLKKCKWLSLKVTPQTRLPDWHHCFMNVLIDCTVLRLIVGRHSLKMFTDYMLVIWTLCPSKNYFPCVLFFSHHISGLRTLITDIYCYTGFECFFFFGSIKIVSYVLSLALWDLQIQCSMFLSVLSHFSTLSLSVPLYVLF